MFGALVFERDPAQLADVPRETLQWLQTAGGFAAFVILPWLIVALPRMSARDRQGIPAWLRLTFSGCVSASALLYVLSLVLWLAGVGRPSEEALLTGKPDTGWKALALDWSLTLAGGLALLAVSLPFFANIPAMRFRRIYALAKLSFKEAVRRRVLYAFSGLLLVFLFASWFIPSAPKDQVRTYVQVVFIAMGLLLIFTAALMSAFSIPTDIKQQTIHTIVTKPAERFEIVAGRFLGFLALMTLVLVVMTTVSLLYVVRGVHPEAAAESLKAREPLYGELSFENTDNPRQATNVGREWDYRSYITRNSLSVPQTARWDIHSVPSSLGARKEVRCEYSFDIYRTTKGYEGREITVTFRFYTPAFRPGNDEKFRTEREAASAERLDQLAEDLGFYEVPSCKVVDYVTLAVNVPGGVFRGAASAPASGSGPPRPPLQVRVVPDDSTQYVGMAKYDFYLRLDDPQGAEQARFWGNFFKAAFGLWLLIALVIALAVVLSTYLNGVISLLVTLLLIAGGTSRDFVIEVASGKNAGGGPTEAFSRLVKRELTGPRMDDSVSAGDRIIGASDATFRWSINRVLFLIPDINGYDTTNYVAEGFHISSGKMLHDFLALVRYLYLWFLLAFFLMRWREIAGAT